MAGEAGEAKSRILVLGATGYIGRFIALAGPSLGHPTFALVRPHTVSSKPDLIHSLQSAGVTILHGSLEDHESLVAAFKQVDIVISAVGGAQLHDQFKVIAAIKEVGTIKRFLPSEFGNDVGRSHSVHPALDLFKVKGEIRRSIEEAGIPYTYVVSNGFAGYFIAPLFQQGIKEPPRDKVIIYGSGDVKAISVVEEDIATYTIKAASDPRALNKTLHIRPSHNILTLNELVEKWEKKISKTLEKETLSEEDFLKQIEGTPFPGNIFPAILHEITIKGGQTNFELGPDDVEATSLYPDVKYIHVDEYLDRFV